MTKTIITLNELKRSNLRSVLSLLLRADGLSRIEIAGRLGCDNTTVSRAVRELIGRGIIDTGGKSNSANGRPRVALRVKPDGPSLIGISLEPDGITGVLTDLKSEPSRVENIRFSRRFSREEYLQAAKDTAVKLCSIAGNKIAGIGITVFGSYYGAECTLEKAAALPMLNGLKLLPFFSGCTGREILVCDHAVALSNYLLRRHPEFGSGSVMLITAGKGLGLVVMENGRRLFSRSNHGGEFGHTVRTPDGIPCACGRCGCLETAVSTAALCRKYRELTGEMINFGELAEKFCSGDPAVDAVIQPAADELAAAVAEQLNNFQADKLVIAGEILKLGSRFHEYFRNKVSENVFSLVRDGLDFYFPSEETADSLPIGASILAAEKYVADFDRAPETEEN